MRQVWATQYISYYSHCCDRISEPMQVKGQGYFGSQFRGTQSIITREGKKVGVAWSLVPKMKHIIKGQCQAQAMVLFFSFYSVQ